MYALAVSRNSPRKPPLQSGDVDFCFVYFSQHVEKLIRHSKPLLQPGIVE